MHRAWGVVVGITVVAALLSFSPLAGSAVPARGPPVAFGGSGHPHDPGGAGWGILQTDGPDIDPDRTVVEVELRPDGSARWRLRYRVRLANRSVVEAFGAVVDAIRANRLEEAGRFKFRTEPVVALASNETGREMALQEVSVTADRHQPPGATTRYGVVTYEFVWTNFAEVADGRIEMGDALVGFFLSEETTMLVSWPDGYGAVEISPPPDETRDGALVWSGPKEFTAGGPRMVVEPTGNTPDALPVSPALLGVGALLAVVLAAGFYRRRGSDGAQPAPGDTGGAGREGTPLPEPAPPPEPEPGSEPEGEPEPEPASSVDTTPEELLSDEERVVGLLEEHGGRMKQQDIVEALEWSETKTSQVITDLHEEETVERYRLGRENVVALPGEMDV